MHMIVVCLRRNEMFCIHAYASHIIFKKVQFNNSTLREKEE